MCEPTTIALIGMGLSGAGAAYNGHQQSKNINRQIKAKNSAAEAEMIRQRGYADEASGVFDESLAGFEKPNQNADLAMAKSKRGAKMEESVTAGSEYAPTRGSAPSVVKGEVARKINQAMKSGKAGARRLGNVGAWGDAQFGNRVALGRSGGKLGEIGSNASRSGGLLAVEQQNAANNAYKNPGMFGDLLNVAGQGAQLYGFHGGDFNSVNNGMGGTGVVTKTGPNGLNTAIGNGGASIYNPVKPGSYTPLAY